MNFESESYYKVHYQIIHTGIQFTGELELFANVAYFWHRIQSNASAGTVMISKYAENLNKNNTPNNALLSFCRQMPASSAKANKRLHFPGLVRIKIAAYQKASLHTIMQENWNELTINFHNNRTF